MAMPNSQIEIKFRSWRYRKWPMVKIHVDGDLIEEKILDQDESILSFPIDLIDGEHLLEIEHFGKSSRDTKIKDGVIDRDTKFLIDTITINGLQLPFSLMRYCKFKADWQGFDRPPGMPDVFKQSCVIGPNGTWELPFATPIEEWIIDQRRIDRAKTNSTVTFESYEPSPHSTIDYKLSDQDKNLIKEIKELIG